MNWVDFEGLISSNIFVAVIRDVAQPGSASRSGRGGRWFESSHPDQYLFKFLL